MSGQQSIMKFFGSKNNTPAPLPKQSPIKGVIQYQQQNIELITESKKRGHSELESLSSTKAEIKTETKKRVNTVEKLKKNNIEEEKTQVSETTTKASNFSSIGEVKKAPEIVIIVKVLINQEQEIVGDCLSNYENFIGELGDWQTPLQSYLKGSGFKQLYKFVESEYKSQTIYPPKELIFNAFKHVSFEDLKVVIVGQDPYINLGEAMGLCFSIPKGVKVPPSLRNIYKALDNDKQVQFKFPNPIHGDLTNWPKQGVLLLNAILTVREGVSNSHQKKGWEQFTDNVINVINQKKEGVVFMLWGSKAQEKAKSVSASKHLILKYAHPSPLAGAGFPNCPHFSQANEYLTSKGKQPINWQV
ncbi:uracil-dna glycosylase [Stylonychia lemnae]|uniref:Uracil-DNA glycosylase n=1 Tax=Stylonychia lemnae TaxID=5949 RepID=A0A078ALW7_STYLE|nr:uracil-dna glycosylase [Stylonychia lemnae]|eukprot:CDW83365.1 uracil-dna glycosylase [Stylonychia lemnae]